MTLWVYCVGLRFGGFVNSCFSFCEVRYFLVVGLVIGGGYWWLLLSWFDVGCCVVCARCLCVLSFVGWSVAFCLVSCLVWLFGYWLFSCW